jgi:hypothetical protein
MKDGMLSAEALPDSVKDNVEALLFGAEFGLGDVPIDVEIDRAAMLASSP